MVTSPTPLSQKPDDFIRLQTEEQFELLFRTYYARLCIYAETIVKSKIQAEDIVQSVYVSLWGERERIEEVRSWNSYLYRMVGNRSINELQRKSNQYIPIEGVASSIKDEEDWIERYFDDERHRQIQVIINDALDRLPPQTRRVVEMSRIEGKKSAEIASQLNISQRTVENLIYRAISQLKRDLSGQDSWVLLLMFKYLSIDAKKNEFLVSKIEK